jgi:copper chaperone CopZ
MHTDLRVEGANCSLCFNDIIERLRAVDGITSVDSSITAGCIAIDHDDLIRADVIDMIGASLHGVAMASNEIVMTEVNPSISVIQCTHDPSLRRTPEFGPAHRGLDTVTDALNRLRADGYTADFYATDQGELGCRKCERTMNPTEVQVDHTIRFEGDSNPDDEDIVFALVCGGGCLGTYTAAYGLSTPPNDTAVLRQLARIAHPYRTR